MTEPSGEVVRQRNREAPFPNEINTDRGDLENYFVHLSEDDEEELIYYDDLPDSFSSVGMDQYPTWLAMLTEADPQHRERASFVYLREDPIEFIYPQNPEIGTESEAIPIKTKKPKIFFPLTRVHSHPDTTCFSPQDLRRVLSLRGIWFEENEFVSEIVGTPRQNFLLLRTEETEFDEPEEVERLLENFQQDAQKMRDAIDNVIRESVKGDLGTKEMADLLINCLYQAEKEVFGADYATYLTTIAATHQIAKEHKIGFYVSNHDGLYRRFTDEDLQSIKNKRKEQGISQRANEIFINAIKTAQEKPKE